MSEAPDLHVVNFNSARPQLSNQPLQREVRGGSLQKPVAVTTRKKVRHIPLIREVIQSGRTVAIAVEESDDDPFDAAGESDLDPFTF